MWVPVGTNLVLVLIAVVLGNQTAIALTAVAAVVNLGAVVLFARESELDKDRIAHLQAAMPTLAALEPDVAVNLGPKPSSVVTQVLRPAPPAPPAPQPGTRQLRSVPRTPIDPG